MRACQMSNREGAKCQVELDAEGHHACACQKGAQQLARHSAIVRVLHKEIARRGLLVQEERWVEELAQREVVQEPDGVRVVSKEARLDLVVRDGARLWWVDFSCFHPYQGTGARRGTRRGKWAVASIEAQKHATYKVRSAGGGRAVANGRVVPLVVNTYGAVGREGLSFFRLVSAVARRLGRDSAGSRLEPLVQSLVVFFVASGVLDAYTTKP